jgi:hypothetical protein
LKTRSLNLEDPNLSKARRSVYPQTAADQYFEYRNCHERTGMLNAVKEVAGASA